MMIKAKLIQSVNFNKVSVFEHLNISLLCSPPQWSSAKRSFRKDEKDLTLILMQITPFSKMQLVYWLVGGTNCEIFCSFLQVRNCWIQNEIVCRVRTIKSNSRMKESSSKWGGDRISLKMMISENFQILWGKSIRLVMAESSDRRNMNGSSAWQRIEG